MSSETTSCAECGRALAEGEQRVETDDAVFCPTCYEHLAAQVRRAVDAQGSDINYSMAFTGGLIGGAAGAAVWWGFTVLTSVAFGLVAVVIGFTVGKGVVMGAGDKRATSLQGLSVGIAVLAFAYASYLVNRSFILKAMEGAELPIVPDLELFVEVAGLGAGIMDLVFLAIVVYQAWKIPAPLRLGRS